MVDTETLKKAMRYCSENYICDGCPHEETSCDILAEALEYIELLEKQIPKWISVNDRVPDKFQEDDGCLVNYLAFMPKFGVDIANYLEPAKSWFCMGMPSLVTHWMQLPEPPKK